MSAIGNYIHSTARGYKEHGIFKDKNFVAYNYAVQKRNVINRLVEKRHEKKDKNELKDKINAIFSDDTNSESKNIFQNEIENKLREKYGDLVELINWKTGKVKGENSNIKDDPEVVNAKMIAKMKIRKRKEDEGIYLNTIKNRLKAIKEMIDSDRVQFKNNVTKKDVQDAYKNLMDRVKTLEKSLGVIPGSNENRLIRADSLLYRQSVDSIIPKGRWKTLGIIQQINNLVDKSFKAAPLNLLQGDLLEYIGAVAPLVGQSCAEDAIQEAFKNVKGSDRSRIEIDSSKFNNKFVNFKTVFNDDSGFFTEKDTVYCSKGKSQGKLDIEIAWKNKDPLRISAKNVNLNSSKYPDVHILSGSSLLYLIQDEDPVFVNHWLNIVSNFNPTENDDILKIREGRETMYFTILYKALTGDTYKRKEMSASLFLVKDNSSSGKDSIYVIDMYDILDKIQQNINNIEDYSSILINNSERFLDLKLINNRIHSEESSDEYAQLRITQLMQQLHSKKIYASIKSSFIKTFK